VVVVVCGWLWWSVGLVVVVFWWLAKSSRFVGD
jgi:hypothetical protein